MEHDWAIVELEMPSNEFGWMPFGWNTGLLPAFRLNAVGFPSNKGFETMWHSFGTIQLSDKNILLTDLDVVNGNSGCPTYGYYTSEDLRVIFGLVSSYGPVWGVSFPLY